MGKLPEKKYEKLPWSHSISTISISIWCDVCDVLSIIYYIDILCILLYSDQEIARSPSLILNEKK